MNERCVASIHRNSFGDARGVIIADCFGAVRRMESCFKVSQSVSPQYAVVEKKKGIPKLLFPRAIAEHVHNKRKCL